MPSFWWKKIRPWNIQLVVTNNCNFTYPCQISRRVARMYNWNKHTSHIFVGFPGGTDCRDSWASWRDRKYRDEVWWSQMPGTSTLKFSYLRNIKKCWSWLVLKKVFLFWGGARFPLGDELLPFLQQSWLSGRLSLWEVSTIGDNDFFKERWLLEEHPFATKNSSTWIVLLSGRKHKPIS